MKKKKGKNSIEWRKEAERVKIHTLFPVRQWNNETISETVKLSFRIDSSISQVQSSDPSCLVLHTNTEKKNIPKHVPIHECIYMPNVAVIFIEFATLLPASLHAPWRVIAQQRQRRTFVNGRHKNEREKLKKKIQNWTDDGNAKAKAKCKRLCLSAFQLM